MTRKTQPWQRWTKLPLAVAIAAGVSTPASAISFYMGDVEAQFNTTLSAGASWRTEDADKRLLAPHDAGGADKHGSASTNNYDDRSEERRVGKECRSRWSAKHKKKKQNN